MKTKLYSIIAVLATLVFAGCSTPEIRIKHNPELFASIPAPEQEMIKQGKIAIGFTPDMVRLALGNPDYIARKIDRSGTAETWRYRGYDTQYDYGFYGSYWGGSPYWGWGGRYGYWGSYYGGPYYGWGGWSAPAPMSDYLRVTIREGRVVQIDQLR